MRPWRDVARGRSLIEYCFCIIFTVVGAVDTGITRLF